MEHNLLQPSYGVVYRLYLPSYGVVYRLHLPSYGVVYRLPLPSYGVVYRLHLPSYGVVYRLYLPSCGVALGYLDTWSGFEAAKTAPWPSPGLHHLYCKLLSVITPLGGYEVIISWLDHRGFWHASHDDL